MTSTKSPSTADPVNLLLSEHHATNDDYLRHLTGQLYAAVRLQRVNAINSRPNTSTINRKSVCTWTLQQFMQNHTITNADGFIGRHFLPDDMTELHDIAFIASDSHTHRIISVFMDD